tara:strand:+ start:5533 stop:5718 length:186 start_codon:yes stop_codon:yes gene_type:complete
MTKYKVLQGINYGPDLTRAEPGDVVDDIPASLITHWREKGIIKSAGSPKKKSVVRKTAEED